MKLGTWLLSLVSPFLAKILLSLGFSVVTIVGLEAALNGMKAQFVATMGSMQADMLNIVLYLWIGKAFGVIFGACTAKLTMWAIQNATSIIGKNPT